MPGTKEEHDAILATKAKLFGTQKLGAEAQLDLVNKPPHYNQGEIECIDYLRDNLSDEGFRGYLEGNAKKYMHRWRYKGGIQDLEKAQWYLARLTEDLTYE